MKLPIGVNGETTVNELIAALLDFPPNAVVKMVAEYTNAELQVDGTVILES